MQNAMQSQSNREQAIERNQRHEQSSLRKLKSKVMEEISHVNRSRRRKGRQLTQLLEYFQNIASSVESGEP